MLFASLKNSVLTSFYTDSKIVSALAESLKENNILIDRFIDPSAGIGIFAKKLREQINIGATLQIEKDIIASKILSALNSSNSSSIINDGFEKIHDRYKGKEFEEFDLIASNIPFGDIKIYDMA